MIVLTGAAGFIGSVLLGYFNNQGITDILCVDRLGTKTKWKNLLGKKFIDFVDRDAFLENLNTYKNIDYIIHIGACTDTTEFDLDYLLKTNYEYSKILFKFATEKQIPFIYASSAATYGAGENGYNDDENLIEYLRPLNPYGFSKQLFDLWVLKQNEKPPFWAGFKFFNVYGPNEYHKGRMASVIFHSFNQLKEAGIIKLFKSHKEGYNHGEQKRDFIYVFDVAKVIFFFYKNNTKSGIYNLGTGQARTFNDLANNVIQNYGKGKIHYIDMPEDIRDKYQYFTEANMDKLKNAGYKDSFYTLEEGVSDYTTNFLMKNYKIF
ncbi:ADP-glyceromanno-heptose 6-epimerase [Deferribacter desulfuricans SSM1]|uniref:ADP-L-glycero-D-manno-heptose-6-epimerase n=1 Tax=Deferribacter desulfuricans (strain DSM 14783 / JCM 11476 / NBRC 101012 / SSM1) TaxID=639282 RepID=D3PCW9_DEFDS|nr:ADP-glyceromanno-heptose 6-epimerase [Deferribacter desulfuricans]BAI80442.1 ADP-glyceromanno-heptose 6-epimerase [Deferribacter desulfuricans SSM1]